MRGGLRMAAMLAVGAIAAALSPGAASALPIDFEKFPDGKTFVTGDDYAERDIFIFGGRVISNDAGGSGGFANAPSGAAVWELRTGDTFDPFDPLHRGSFGERRALGFWYASSDWVFVQMSREPCHGCADSRFLPPTQAAGDVLDTWQFASFSRSAIFSPVFYLRVEAFFPGQRILLDDLVVPEPSASLLLLGGISLLALGRRRKVSSPLRSTASSRSRTRGCRRRRARGRSPSP